MQELKLKAKGLLFHESFKVKVALPSSDTLEEGPRSYHSCNCYADSLDKKQRAYTELQHFCHQQEEQLKNDSFVSYPYLSYPVTDLLYADLLTPKK